MENKDLLLSEFSKNRVNRSNNRGKINYSKLFELLKWETPKNLDKLDSKNSEKKRARREWQKYILFVAENVKNLSNVELKKIHENILAVQGSYNNAKELYNYSTFEKEDKIKLLFSALQTAQKKNFTNVTKTTKSKKVTEKPQENTQENTQINE